MFRRAPIVSDDLGGWILDSFEWTMQRGDVQHWRQSTRLILPTKAFFDAPAGDGVEIASAIGHNIMALLGMDIPKIRFEPLPTLPDEIAQEYGKTSEVAGQYWNDAQAPLITYNPQLMRRPTGFINVMAHELMHAHLADVVDEAPSGEAAHELATDLHCITHGFGIFQMTDAEDSGWSGYMTQPSRAFALAVFLQLTGHSKDEALAYLPSRSAKLLRRAIKECNRDWGDEIRALCQDT